MRNICQKIESCIKKYLVKKKTTLKICESSFFLLEKVLTYFSKNFKKSMKVNR